MIQGIAGVDPKYFKKGGLGGWVAKTQVCTFTTQKEGGWDWRPQNGKKLPFLF